jgi:hypothetical protein
MMAPPDATEQSALWNIRDALASTLIRKPKHLIILGISRTVLNINGRGSNRVATFVTVVAGKLFANKDVQQTGRNIQYIGRNRHVRNASNGQSDRKTPKRRERCLRPCGRLESC